MRSSAFQRTYSPGKADLVHQWHVLDADGQTLGRLATQAASLLRGKHNPRYVPHMDCGDYVVVVNADKIQVTGNKRGQKMYYRHSGYPGGLKEETLEHLMNRKPERVVELAIEGMLPHTALGRAMYKKLRVYKGPAHPHQGQLAAPLGAQSAPKAASAGTPPARPAPATLPASAAPAAGLVTSAPATVPATPPTSPSGAAPPASSPATVPAEPISAPTSAASTPRESTDASPAETAAPDAGTPEERA
jgi:large subunit ribosomal protein L13